MRFLMFPTVQNLQGKWPQLSRTSQRVTQVLSCAPHYLQFGGLYTPSLEGLAPEAAATWGHRNSFKPAGYWDSIPKRVKGSSLFKRALEVRSLQ